MVIVVLLSASHAARSQPYDVHGRNTLRFTVPAKNHFLDKHTDHMILLLWGDTVSLAHILPRKDDTAYLNRTFLVHPFGGKMFSFNFGAEADRLVFAKKYPALLPPVVPRVEIQNILGQKDGDKLYQISQISFFRDSTVYTYVRHDEFGRKGAVSGNGIPSRYTGDICQVAVGIAREMASTATRVPFDSVLVFQAVVFRGNQTAGYGRFELEHLLYGTPSAFSRIAAKHLMAKENNFFDDGKSKWVAARLELPMSTRIKVYVRLERDGSVTIQLPKYLNNFTGD